MLTIKKSDDIKRQSNVKTVAKNVTDWVIAVNHFTIISFEFEPGLAIPEH